MEKYEYFSGVPEVGIVPRARHAGPLMRHVYEQEHGRGGVFSEGMVAVHPVGLPHGPHPKALAALLDDKRPQVFEEVGIMADFANPAKISEFALGLSRPDYMASWAGYTTEPRFLHDPGRLARVLRLAGRLADARDTLRPGASEEQDRR